ncbi:hypothetical protein SLE2022_133500 [Rubroshorea leprosula]
MMLQCANTLACYLKTSLWVKWLEEVYLKSGSIWQVDIRNDSPWSGRKILQLRPIMNNFICIEVRESALTSLFFDCWLGGYAVVEQVNVEELKA